MVKLMKWFKQRSIYNFTILQFLNAPKLSSKELNDNLTKPNRFLTCILFYTDDKKKKLSGNPDDILKSAKKFLKKLNSKEDTTKAYHTCSYTGRCSMTEVLQHFKKIYFGKFSTSKNEFI